MKSESIEAVRLMAQEVAEKEGCRLYDIEFVKGPRKTLRVYIDRSGEPVSIDDCTNVSRELNLLLDTEDVALVDPYDLEVSSPGLERRLTQPWHFEQSVGKKIKVRYRSGNNKANKDIEANKGSDKGATKGSISSEAILQAFDGKTLELLVGKNTINVELESVEKAQVVFEMKGQQKR